MRQRSRSAATACCRRSCAGRRCALARAATLDAGYRLFSERGYDHVTVADICAAADIGHRTFFHYFPGKEDLLASPAQDMTDRLTAVLDQAPPAAGDGQALRAALADLAVYVLAHRAKLVLYRQIIVTSATLRLSVFWNLPAHELRVAQQLRARHRRGGAPDLNTRLLVARAVAAFRVWLDLSLGGDDGQDADAAALGLFDQIFDADPLLAT